jgi:hypothetical protein
MSPHESCWGQVLSRAGPVKGKFCQRPFLRRIMPAEHRAWSFIIAARITKVKSRFTSTQYRRKNSLLDTLPARVVCSIFSEALPLSRG